LLSESQLRFIVEVEPEGRRLAGRVVKFLIRIPSVTQVADVGTSIHD